MREHRRDGRLAAARRADDEVARAVVQAAEQRVELRVAACRRILLEREVMLGGDETGGTLAVMFDITLPGGEPPPGSSTSSRAAPTTSEVRAAPT
jgi:hypothetical protein